MYKISIVKCCTYTTTTTTTPGSTETIETPYFIIQNSWGDQWGEAGFIKIAAVGGYGVCGMNQIVQWIST